MAPLTPTRDNPLDRFLEFVLERGIELYPAQEEAVLELFSGKKWRKILYTDADIKADPNLKTVKVASGK